MKTFKLLLIATVVILMGSCQKSAPGGGSSSSTPSSMDFKLKAINPVVVVNLTTGPGTIQWTSGSASATEVKLEAKKNGSEIEFKSTGIRQVDLFASVVASLGTVSIPAATYTEVEFKITLNQNGSNAAMELNGQYTNGTGGIIPVVFSINSLFILKAEQNNVVVNGSNSITSLTTLDLSFVSRGITQTLMNSATVTNGKIIISGNSNVNLYNIIVNNLLEFHHVDVNHQ
jgi:hypothetical protein